MAAAFLAAAVAVLGRAARFRHDRLALGLLGTGLVFYSSGSFVFNLVPDQASGFPALADCLWLLLLPARVRRAGGADRRAIDPGRGRAVARCGDCRGRDRRGRRGGRLQREPRVEWRLRRYWDVRLHDRRRRLPGPDRRRRRTARLAGGPLLVRPRGGLLPDRHRRRALRRRGAARRVGAGIADRRDVLAGNTSAGRGRLVPRRVSARRGSSRGRRGSCCRSDARSSP